MFIVHPLSLRSCKLVFILSLVWILCAGAAIQAQPKAEPKGGSDKAAEIKTLLHQRHELLTKVVARIMDQYKLGAVDFTKVAQAERDLLRATLELEESPEKKLAALRQHQKTAKGIVELAETRFKAGSIGEVDLLQSKVVLLEVQIELLR